VNGPPTTPIASKKQTVVSRPLYVAPDWLVTSQWKAWLRSGQRRNGSRAGKIPPVSCGD